MNAHVPSVKQFILSLCHFAWLTTALTSTAGAFIDPPEIVPSLPTAGSVINVRIRAGLCDTFLTLGPLDRELEIIGNRVILRMVGQTTTDLPQCIFIPSTFEYLVGPLPQGSYDLEIYLKPVFAPNPPILVQTGTITVGPNMAIPIPSGSVWASGFLLLSIGLIAMMLGKRSGG